MNLKESIGSRILKLEEEIHSLLHGEPESQTIEDVADFAIDALLQLKEALRVGAPTKENSPEIIFPDRLKAGTGFADQVVIKDSRRFISNESLSQLCLRMSCCIAEFKKSIHHFHDVDLFSTITAFQQKLEAQCHLTARHLEVFYFLLDYYFPERKDREKVAEFYADFLRFIYKDNNSVASK
jgi:hypothetical protein